MDIQTVRAVFMWCTIINGGLLIFSFVICAAAGDWIYRTHSKFFPIPRESFNLAIYYFLGFFKIFVFACNLVPYLALLIVA